MRAAAIGFGIIYAILQIALNLVVQPNYKPDVSERFIDRSTTIPSMVQATNDHGSLTHDNLSAWISNSANDGQRQGYILPIIVPLDLLYLAALGCFLGSLSQLVARHIARVSAWSPWRWWLFPVSYMISDLTEDTIILLTLSKTISLKPMIFVLLRIATIAKLITVTIAIGQTALLVVLWGHARLGLLRRHPA